MFCSITRSTFRSVCEFCCWINLVVCAAAGYNIGNAMGAPARQATMWSAGNPGTAGHPIEGLFIGAIVGVITSLIYGGFIAAFLRIDENTNLIRESQMSNGGATSSNAKPSPQISNAKPSPQISRQPTAVPEGVVARAKCKNCSKFSSCNKSFVEDESVCEEHAFFRG